jgi:hypothetical protein
VLPWEIPTQARTYVPFVIQMDAYGDDTLVFKAIRYSRGLVDTQEGKRLSAAKWKGRLPNPLTYKKRCVGCAVGRVSVRA